MAHEVAVDANLLVLWIVGQTDPSNVGRHRRLSGYSTADFLLLSDHLGDASVIVTPNVMTEASNLLVYGVSEPLRSTYLFNLGLVADTAFERYVASSLAKEDHSYSRLGLADAAWLTLLERGAHLTTVDVGLYLAALRKGVEAVNFNHLRDGITI